MKYGKLINNSLDIKEVEKGIEVGGTTTEQQLIEQGYKPLCEIEEPEGAEYFVYREYDACFVQEWRMKDEPLQEDDIWTSDSGFDPSFSDIQRVQKDLIYIESNINTYNFSANDALEVKDIYPAWKVDLSVNVGERYLYEDTLWEVIQAHTTQENWKPSLSTASLWKTVDVEHEGTLEDPIVYIPPMQLYNGKYYKQNDIVYKCIRDSGIPLSHDLSALVGTYVEVAQPATYNIVYEEGVLENPIDYVFNKTLLIKDKYYKQNNKIYKCIKEAGITLSYNLSDLVGTYVELIK